MAFRSPLPGRGELCATTALEELDESYEDLPDAEKEMANVADDVVVPKRVLPPRVAELAHPRTNRRRLGVAPKATLTALDDDEAQQDDESPKGPSSIPRNRTKLEVDFNFYQRQLERKRASNDRQLKAILAEVSAQRERIATMLDETKLEEKREDLRRRQRAEQRARENRVRQRMEKAKLIPSHPVPSQPTSSSSPPKQSASPNYSPPLKMTPRSIMLAEDQQKRERYPQQHHSQVRNFGTYPQRVIKRDSPQPNRSILPARTPSPTFDSDSHKSPPIFSAGQGPLAEAQLLFFRAQTEARKATAAKRAADELLRGARAQLLQSWREEANHCEDILTLLTIELRDAFDPQVMMIQRFLLAALARRERVRTQEPTPRAAEPIETPRAAAFGDVMSHESTITDARTDYARLVVTNGIEGALLVRLRELCATV